jgi:HKD family nuclease
MALQAEVPSADRIDLLCAFIKWSGLRLLQPVLSAYLQAGGELRVLSTVYLGATDRRALDWLAERGAQVRVSADTRRTRLHAKAWLFHRRSGASTAYIGSSNLSSAALLDGLEWNVRLAALETPAMLQKFQANFDAYWEEGEFEPYAATPDDQARLDHQLALARGDDSSSTTAPLAWFHLRPYAYQQEMLDQLEAERSLHQRFRNLVVAATGTGKTVLAAFDVARLHRDFPEQFPYPEPPRLLFIAHRKEILQQALLTFRQVLRDGSFGELQVDGERPSDGRHVFASVQSLAQLDPAAIDPAAYDVVIVDEFHHAGSITSPPGCCSASPPPPSAPTGSTSSSGSTAASPPSCASGPPSTRACSAPSTTSASATTPTSPPSPGARAVMCPPSSRTCTPATIAVWI